MKNLTEEQNTIAVNLAMKEQKSLKEKRCEEMFGKNISIREMTFDQYMEFTSKYGRHGTLSRNRR